MLTPAANPLEKIVQGVLKMLGRLLKERAHASIVIVVRDGKVQFIKEDRTYLPENLPES
jgi:hypothetical protein